MSNPQPQRKSNKGLRRWLHKPELRPIRRAVREDTAGGIVWRRNPEGVTEFLMIQDSKARWTLPKGHVEEGEKAEETALREVKEETGISGRITGWLGKINFRYRRGDALVMMNTSIYLIEAEGDTNKIQKEEWMKSIGWFNAATSLDLIEYEDMHKLILLALKKIRNGS